MPAESIVSTVCPIEDIFDMELRFRIAIAFKMAQCTARTAHIAKTHAATAISCLQEAQVVDANAIFDVG